MLPLHENLIKRITIKPLFSSLFFVSLFVVPLVRGFASLHRFHLHILFYCLFKPPCSQGFEESAAHKHHNSQCTEESVSWSPSLKHLLCTHQPVFRTLTLASYLYERMLNMCGMWTCIRWSELKRENKMKRLQTGAESPSYALMGRGTWQWCLLALLWFSVPVGPNNMWPGSQPWYLAPSIRENDTLVQNLRRLPRCQDESCRNLMTSALRGAVIPSSRR